MKMTLTYRSGSKAGQGLSFESGRVLLGRDDSVCNMVFDLSDAMVSRQHAEIVFDGNAWKLNHLSQTNQSIVNGSPVSQAVLRDGDVLTLGTNGPTVAVKFELAATVAATPQQLGIQLPPQAPPVFSPPPPAPSTNPMPPPPPQPAPGPPPMPHVVPYAAPSMPMPAGPGFAPQPGMMGVPPTVPHTGAKKGGGMKILLLGGGVALAFLLLVGAVIVGYVMFAQKTLFEDNFTAKKPGWTTYADKEKGRVEIGSGKIRMEASPKPDFASVAANILGEKNEGSPGVSMAWYAEKTFDDFDARIRAKQISGGTAPYGLIFRMKGEAENGSWYWFVIRKDGQYSLAKAAKKFEVLVPWTSDTAIKTGQGEENLLRVTVKGSKINLFINDKALKTVTDSGTSEGHVGAVTIAFQNETVVNFTDLRVLEFKGGE